MRDKKLHQMVRVCAVLLLIGTMALPPIAVGLAEKKILSKSIETQSIIQSTPYNFTAPCIVRAVGFGHIDCRKGSYNFTFSPFGYLFIFQFFPPSTILHKLPIYDWTAGQFTGIWSPLVYGNIGSLVFFKGFLLIGSISGTSYIEYWPGGSK